MNNMHVSAYVAVRICVCVCAQETLCTTPDKPSWAPNKNTIANEIKWMRFITCGISYGADGVREKLKRISGVQMCLPLTTFSIHTLSYSDTHSSSNRNVEIYVWPKMSSWKSVFTPSHTIALPFVLHSCNALHCWHRQFGVHLPERIINLQCWRKRCGERECKARSRKRVESEEKREIKRILQFGYERTAISDDWIISVFSKWIDTSIIIMMFQIEGLIGFELWPGSIL